MSKNMTVVWPKLAIFIIFLGFALYAEAKPGTQPNTLLCGSILPSEANLIHGLEVMEASNAQLEQQRQVYANLKKNGRLQGMAMGILPSNRPGKVWGRIEISKNVSIELGGTPRLIQEKFDTVRKSL